ncbi:MAG: TolC family protein [Clostridiaceae bacterium]|mgnify:CR=1 FL=1|nr:TolC family protein [Clostridiaceae bacterium]
MKKIVSIALIFFTLVFVFQTNAQEKEAKSISYNSAAEIMLKNSNTIKKQKQSEKKAFFQYNNFIQSSRGISTDGMTVDTPFGEMKFKYPKNLQVLLMMRREFYPVQMKYGWDMAVKGSGITESALKTGLRDLYLGFMKADMDYDLGLKKLDLAVRKYEISKLKLERGLISQIEFDEAEYEYLKAQKDSDASKRNRENMQRSLNSFLGVPVDTVYEKALYEEMNIRNEIKSVDYYVEKALKERLETISPAEEIKLKELYMSISARNDAHLIYTDIRKEYEKAADDIESLKVKLEKAKLDVENNIKSAYIDVKKESYNVQNMAKNVSMQKRSFDKMKSQYDQGLVPKIALDEYEIAIKELQNSFDLVVYMYNTKVMKLNEAAGLGPAY